MSELRYIFAIGAVPGLSEAELRTQVAASNMSTDTIRQHGEYITLAADAGVDILQLFNRLGGSLYVGEEIATLGKDAVQDIAAALEHIHDDGKIRFGLSGVSDKVGIQVKKELKARGHSARFVSIKNMASIVHNNLIERQSHLTVHQGRIYLTKAVHDFEAMAEFDESRPAYDDVSGMLPPKLARMMLNIAGVREETKLLDAFCGSGTVLLEAMQIGVLHMYGSDISGKAIADTETNMTWMAEQLQAEGTAWGLHETDVRNLSDHISPGTIDTIVSEPYMGKPKHGNESSDELAAEVKELSTLFHATLESFASVLTDGGTVVFSKPRFRFEDGWKTVPWEDGLQEFGFEIVPLLPNKDMVLYAREGQHVGREIWKLRKI